MVSEQYPVVVDYIIFPVTWKRTSFRKQKRYVPDPSLRHTICLQEPLSALCRQNEVTPGVSQTRPQPKPRKEEYWSKTITNL